MLLDQKMPQNQKSGNKESGEIRNFTFYMTQSKIAWVQSTTNPKMK
jgi:hypothetical protein